LASWPADEQLAANWFTLTPFIRLVMREKGRRTAKLYSLKTRRIVVRGTLEERGLFDTGILAE
jgi:hypothetical protein